MKKVLLMTACVIMLASCNCNDNGRYNCRGVNDCDDVVRCNEKSTYNCNECEPQRHHETRCNDRTHHRHNNYCNDGRHRAEYCVENNNCENRCETDRCR